MSNKCFTCQEVADRYGVKLGTVWSWIRTGKLSAINTGRNYAITPEDLKEFEDARKTNVNA